jgi:uncharacterized protein (DUF58 family)
LHIALLVDASASMRVGAPPKLEHALKLAAALCYIGLANLDRVSVHVIGESLRDRLPPARGKGRIFKVFEFLRTVTPTGATRLGKSIEGFVHETPRRGVAVVLSDFYDQDGYQSGLDLLRFHRFETYAIQVIAEEEERPRLRGDVALVDCETGVAREITVSARLLAEYTRRHAAYCQGVSDYCRGHAVPYFRTRTDEPFDELVLRVFRAGGFLK